MDARRNAVGDSLVLVLSAASRPLRTRLGPLAWAALETLALCAEPLGDSWVAVRGVRAVAGELGVTKDTAGRALSELTAVGLIFRQRFAASDPARRSGYRLQLPAGVQLQMVSEVLGRPKNVDGDGCPRSQDADLCRKGSDTEQTADAEGARATRRRPAVARGPSRRGRIRQKAENGQGRLFDVEVPM